MTITVSNNTPRVSYSVAQGQTQTSFTVNFEFFAEADLNVYVDDTLKSLTTHYTVSGGNGSTGAVAISVTGATGGSTVVITRDIALERTTDFPTSGAFNISSLNTELDKLVAIDADVDDTISRSIRLKDQDASASMELPLKASRLGTVLGFNATTGAAEAGPTITAVQSLADVTTSINLLGTSAVVEDMGLLATSANITAMGLLGTSSNVTAMGLLGNSTVIADMALLGTSDVVADMALLATTDVIADMNTLATSDIISDLNTLATSDIVTDMNLLATSDNVTAMGLLGTSSNVTAMGLLGTSAVVEDMGFLGTSANVTAMGLLGTSANVTAMGLLGTSAVVTDMGLLGTSAVVADMDLLATSANVTNMATLGASGVVSNIATVAGSVTNVNTVATNVSGVNSFAERYRVASSAPTSSLDVGDLYFDTTANELKVYKSSGWAAAGSTVNGTSARFTYNISGTPTSVTGADANGNTLAYDAGFIDVYLNGVRLSGADITITSGDTVTFASALADGDLVDIVAFGTFSVANITSTGALNSGSITSGFGNIDTGSSTITTTGAISGGALSGTSLDLNGGELILDSDNDTSITSDTDDRVDIKVAGSDVVHVTSTGLGIGTTSPSRTLHVTRSDGTGTVVKVGNTGSTASSIEFANTGSTDTISIGAENNDLVLKSDDGDISLNTTGDPATASLFVERGGNVGIGTDSPSDTLDIERATGVVSLGLQSRDSSDTKINFGDNGDGDVGIINYAHNIDAMIFTVNASERMRIGSTGSLNVMGVYNDTTTSSANVNVASDGHIRRVVSSRRYKNTINDATHGLKELLTLRSVTYKGNNEEFLVGGLIAEEVHDSGLTEFVEYDDDGKPDSLAYSNMVSLCIKAIQELSAKVDTLEARIATLESK